MRVFYQVLFGFTIIGALSSPAQAGGITIHFGDGYRHHNALKYNHHGYTKKRRASQYYKRRGKLRRHVIPCTFGLNRRNRHSHYVQPKGKRGRMNGRSISYIHGF